MEYLSIGCFTVVVFVLGALFQFYFGKAKKKENTPDLFELGCKYMTLSNLYGRQQELLSPIFKDLPPEKAKNAEEFVEVLHKTCDLTKEIIQFNS